MATPGQLSKALRDNEKEIERALKRVEKLLLKSRKLRARIKSLVRSYEVEEQRESERLLETVQTRAKKIKRKQRDLRERAKRIANIIAPVSPVSSTPSKKPRKKKRYTYDELVSAIEPIVTIAKEENWRISNAYNSDGTIDYEFEKPFQGDESIGFLIDPFFDAFQKFIWNSAWWLSAGLGYSWSAGTPNYPRYGRGSFFTHFQRSRFAAMNNFVIAAKIREDAIAKGLRVETLKFRMIFWPFASGSPNSIRER